VVIVAMIHVDAAGMARTRAGQRDQAGDDGAKQREENDRLNHA
jgi:hypothetical protein